MQFNLRKYLVALSYFTKDFQIALKSSFLRIEENKQSQFPNCDVVNIVEANCEISCRLQL